MDVLALVIAFLLVACSLVGSAFILSGRISEREDR
jgi:hypothetical protein